MAFFDKLKGAADKAKEAAIKAAAVAKEKMEQQQQAVQQAEEDRKNGEKQKLYDYLLANYSPLDNDAWAKMKQYEKIATEEEVKELNRLISMRWEKERNERTEKCLEAALSKTDCDLGKGDCCWHEDKFYCTCGSDVDCPRKKYIKASQYGNIHAPEHWPYIKVLAATTRFKYGEDSYYSYVNSYDAKWGEFISVFFKRFLPNTIASSDSDMRNLEGYEASSEYDNLYNHGLGDDNPLMAILYAINEKTDGQVKMSLPKLVWLEKQYGIDMRQDFLKNPSLYNRSLRDMVYTARILDTVSNPEKLSKYFKDSGKVEVDQLYNADGTIKDAGVGGPKNGHYGDVIYNIVASWSEEEE